MNDRSPVTRLRREVVDAGICAGCGACVALAANGQAQMVRTNSGMIPEFPDEVELPPLAWEACPGKGVDYPDLYRKHFGSLPDDWRLGRVDRLWTGHAGDPQVRRQGASGGVLTAVLLHLLESGRIDAAVLARQGVPEAQHASWVIARSADEIRACAQSIYAPVSILDALPALQAGKRYAMTCLPEQAAALRVLQQAGDARASQVNWVLGPYTGTALDGGAIRSLLRAHRVADEDAITSLQWRAGEWPGQLEITTESGRTVRSKKVYYNFLIPFHVTQTSLLSMDFANEFTDLSVGDAWSPQFEAMGQGHSVVLSRNAEMSAVIDEMERGGLLQLEDADPLKAAAMHGHMIDFKKRGGYLRNRWREATFRKAPDIGLDPEPIGVSRLVVEVVIGLVFGLCRNGPARWVMQQIPQWILGPLFNRLRLGWKQASKPAKRKGLRTLRMRVRPPDWRSRDF